MPNRKQTQNTPTHKQRGVHKQLINNNRTILDLSITNDIVSSKIYDKRDADGWLRMGPRDFCRHILSCGELKVSKGAKIRNRIQSSTTPDPQYQWKSDILTVDITNESQEVR